MTADTPKIEPLDMSDQPEWETVAQERDYWKRLALGYAAKLRAIEYTMSRSWTVTLDPQNGQPIVVEDEPKNVG